MLPKKSRLGTNSLPLQGDYAFKSPLFSAKKSPNGIDHVRVAIIISKKTSPLSVERHRIRRQIAEAIQKTWNLNASFDVMIIIAPKAARLGNADLRSAVEELGLRLLG